MEAYRDLLELVCKVPLGSQVWRDTMGKFPASLWHHIVVIVTKVEAMKPPTTQN